MSRIGPRPRGFQTEHDAAATPLEIEPDVITGPDWGIRDLEIACRDALDVFAEATGDGGCRAVAGRGALIVDYGAMLGGNLSLAWEETGMPFQWIDLRAAAVSAPSRPAARFRLLLNRHATAALWVRYPQRLLAHYEVAELEQLGGS